MKVFQKVNVQVNWMYSMMCWQYSSEMDQQLLWFGIPVLRNGYSPIHIVPRWSVWYGNL